MTNFEMFYQLCHNTMPKITRFCISCIALLCPIVAFGQDFVGKIPTQERKIKISQLEERSNRVPPQNFMQLIDSLNAQTHSLIGARSTQQILLLLSTTLLYRHTSWWMDIQISNHKK